MLSTNQKLLADRNSLINIATDLLLSVLVGLAISISIFIGLWIVMFGAPSFSDVINFFALPGSDTEQAIKLAFMIPILVPLLSILAARHLIQRVESRKSWFLPMIVVAVISTIIGLLSVSLILNNIGWTLSYEDMVGFFLLYCLFCIFLGFLVGMILSTIFIPKRRGFKILVAVISSGIIGGLFEIALMLGLSID